MLQRKHYITFCEVYLTRSLLPFRDLMETICHSSPMDCIETSESVKKYEKGTTPRRGRPPVNREMFRYRVDVVPDINVKVRNVERPLHKPVVCFVRIKNQRDIFRFSVSILFLCTAWVVKILYSRISRDYFSSNQKEVLYTSTGRNMKFFSRGVYHFTTHFLQL